MNGTGKNYIFKTLLNLSNDIDKKLDDLDNKYSEIFNILQDTNNCSNHVNDDAQTPSSCSSTLNEFPLKPNIISSPKALYQPCSKDAFLLKYFPKSLNSSKNNQDVNNGSQIKIFNVNENIAQESLGGFSNAENNLMKTSKFISHECSSKCLSYFSYDLKNFHSDVSILYIPIQTGWNRIVKNNAKVVYVSPCGLNLSNYRDLLNYLIKTKSLLPIDYFNFSENLDITRNFDATANLIEEDASEGSEKKYPIPVVNSFDYTYPPVLQYSCSSLPSQDVTMLNDPSYLCCCSCTDLCQDVEKCECQRLTAQSAIKIGVRLFNPSTATTSTLYKHHLDRDNYSRRFSYSTGGYMYRRLPQPLGTGVYECNSSCKCNKRLCLNRVVQNGINYKLQLFKTYEKGWGIRCLNDIPLGSFISVYTGRILTDKKAELLGYHEGDEYLAQIDFIECAEYLKEQYAQNNGLVDPDDIVAGNYNNHDNDNNNSITYQSIDHGGNSNKRLQISANKSKGDETSTLKSTRSLFDGGEPKCFVMDAKREGNIARYFNHSCDPNLFVQNVFIDTHDIRIPNIAFFANRTIPAGSELTWNYGYEIGSVNGKEIICRCLSYKCSGRLL